MPAAGFAQVVDGTWVGNPGANDYGVPENWTSGAAPIGTATFSATSTNTSILISNRFNPPGTTSFNIVNFRFDSGGPQYTFTIDGGSTEGTPVAPGSLTFTGGYGTGIGSVTSVTETPRFTVQGTLNFTNGSVDGGALIDVPGGGSVNYFNTAQSQYATITVDGGYVHFDDTTIALNTNFTVNNNGYLQFDGTAYPSFATITVNSGGYVAFYDLSDAFGTHFINNAGGLVDFTNTNGNYDEGVVHTGSLEGAGEYYLGNDTVQVQQVGSTTVSGIISDCGTDCAPMHGTLELAGSGTLTLSGANTYSGGTILTAGVLVVGTDTVGTPGNITSSAIGTGPLTFNGGTLRAGGNFTIANDVTIAARSPYSHTGTLDAGGYVFTLSGTIADQSGAPSPGYLVISSTGAPGTVVLSGTNTYTGGTYVTSGATLALTNNASAGTGTITLLDGSTLKFAAAGLNLANAVSLGGSLPALQPPPDPTFDTGAFTETVSGTISGSGTLTKLGSGTLILTGTDSYTGATNVQQGTLAVNGSAAATVVTVASGAVLGGSGTVGGIVAASGGTVAPGVLAPLSTLTSAGAVSFAAGATYRININAGGQSDKLVSNAAATLAGGTVQVLAAPGAYSTASRYTILTASGGVSGAFAGSSVSSNLAFLTPLLSYDANDVYLGFAQTASFPAIGGTENQVATATAIAAQPASSPLYQVILGQSASGAQYAFDQLSGEIHASAVSAAFEDSRLPREAILDRLAAAGGMGAPQATAVQGNPASGIVAWAQAFGASGRLGGDGNAGTLTRTVGGFIAGMDKSFDGGARVGMAAGYTHSSMEASSRSSNGSVGSGFVGLYGGAEYGPARLRAGFLWASNDYYTSRQPNFSGYDDQSSATYHGDTLQGFAEAGWRIGLGGAADSGFVEPFVGLLGVNVSTDSFSENGGSSALNGAGKTQGFGASTLGARAEKTLAWTHPVTLEGLIGWRHVFGTTSPEADLAFQSQPGTGFTVEGAPIAQNALQLEAGAGIRLSPQVTAGLYYSGMLSSDANDNAIEGRLAISF